MASWNGCAPKKPSGKPSTTAKKIKKPENKAVFHHRAHRVKPNAFHHEVHEVNEDKT